MRVTMRLSRMDGLEDRCSWPSSWWRSPPARRAGAAAPGAAGTPGPDALKVVTTTTVFADIVQNVGGTPRRGDLDHPAGRRPGGLRADAG